MSVMSKRGNAQNGLLAHLAALFLPFVVFDFCLPLFYATVQSGPYNIFKNFFINFLPMKTLKKRASKVAHNRPKPFFFHSPAQPTAY